MNYLASKRDETSGAKQENRTYISRLQWATNVVETFVENDAIRYLTTYSIFFSSSVNFLISPVPKSM